MRRDTEAWPRVGDLSPLRLLFEGLPGLPEKWEEGAPTLLILTPDCSVSIVDTVLSAWPGMEVVSPRYPRLRPSYVTVVPEHVAAVMRWLNRYESDPDWVVDECTHTGEDVHDVARMLAALWDPEREEAEDALYAVQEVQWAASAVDVEADRCMEVFTQLWEDGHQRMGVIPGAERLAEMAASLV